MRAPLLLLALLAALAGCRADAPTTDGGLDTGAATRVSTGAAASAVEAAEAFLATLEHDARTAVQADLALDAAATWSNLPVSMVQRNGLALSDLTAPQREAALALVQTALSDAGYATFQALRAADSVLAAQPAGARTVGARPDGGPPGSASPPPGPPPGATGGGPGELEYGPDLYWIAVLGEPSTAEPWMLQLGGHHYALNVAYDGYAVSPTPNFVGVEPLTFTVDGVTYAPMAERADAVLALLASLSPDEREAARLDGSFHDVLLGPGADFAFPDQSGLAVAGLSGGQRAAVADAVRAWVEHADEDVAAALLATYTSEAALDATTVGFVGTGGLTERGDYVRIDGPRVWIEIAAQGGVVLSGVHYHSVWRDKALDYGGLFSRPD